MHKNMGGIGVLLIIAIFVALGWIMFYKGQDPLTNFYELIGGDGALLFRGIGILFVAGIISMFL